MTRLGGTGASRRKQGTEIPESVLKEIEDIGSGLSPEERGDPLQVTVFYAGGGERPSVPPADLHDAPWRVAQRKELRELQRQATKRKSRYPALRGTARRRIALKKRAGISRTPVKQRLERPITGRALRLSDRVKDLAQQPPVHGERRRVALPGSVVGLKAALSGDPTEGVCCSRSGCKTLWQESANDYPSWTLVHPVTSERGSSCPSESGLLKPEDLEALRRSPRRKGLGSTSLKRTSQNPCWRRAELRLDWLRARRQV